MVSSASGPAGPQTKKLRISPSSSRVTASPSRFPSSLRSSASKAGSVKTAGVPAPMAASFAALFRSSCSMLRVSALSFVIMGSSLSF